MSHETRRDNFCIVDNKAVAFFQVMQNIAEMAVFHFSGLFI